MKPVVGCPAKPPTAQNEDKNTKSNKTMPLQPNRTLPSDSRLLHLPRHHSTSTIPNSSMSEIDPNPKLSSLPLPPDPPNTTASHQQPHPDNNFGKRQRRPSVRLVQIGDQPPYEPNPTKPHHPWKLSNDHSSSKSSKTRPLTNLVQNGGHQTLATEMHFSAEGQQSRKFTSNKRVKTNWSAKMEYSADRDDDDDDDAFEARSDSPLKYPSQVHSIDNETLSFWNRRPVRARVSDNETENVIETDYRDGKRDLSADGVRDWLIGLGLGRYAAVFEIHEVDDEVLPLLTLDDLKDMGINAVGSRRKMFTAIQKLRKGFS